MSCKDFITNVAVGRVDEWEHITFPCWFSDWLVICWSQAPRQICYADFFTLP